MRSTGRDRSAIVDATAGKDGIFGGYGEGKGELGGGQLSTRRKERKRTGGDGHGRRPGGREREEVHLGKPPPPPRAAKEDDNRELIWSRGQQIVDFW